MINTLRKGVTTIVKPKRVALNCASVYFALNPHLLASYNFVMLPFVLLVEGHVLRTNQVKSFAFTYDALTSVLGLGKENSIK